MKFLREKGKGTTDVLSRNGLKFDNYVNRIYRKTLEINIVDAVRSYTFSFDWNNEN